MGKYVNFKVWERKNNLASVTREQTGSEVMNWIPEYGTAARDSTEELENDIYERSTADGQEHRK